MATTRSRITAQGQVSIPSTVRKKLGIGPGAVLEWKEEEGQIVVQRIGSFDSADIHRAVFKSKLPVPKTLAQLKQGLKDHVRTRYARD